MVIMLNRDQAALLFIQLLCQVCAGTLDQKNISMSRGDSVMFTCNTSVANVTDIHWIKGRYYFAHSFLFNQTLSNLTSHKLTIDISLPSKLNISDLQHGDAGLYKCIITGKTGTRTIEWNLTVSGETEEFSPSSPYFYYMLTAVVGLLCLLTSAVCLYRKLRSRTPDQSPAVQEQFHLQSEDEVALSQRQSGTDSRQQTKNKRRSQYMERLNSIYGL